ncbi:MAG TPA: acyl-CoA dehydrogenase family protein [Candidatus Bathyarchaeia archaeon]|nr:acyl-CoA dehydrogenase family protein [Candidatus Bathyarchaeia archaeon]
MTQPLVAFPLSEEQRRIQELVRGLADSTFRDRAARWDEREEYPWDNVKELVAHNLMGMTFPVEYGGRGAGVLEAVLAIEAAARVCGVTGRILVDSNFGAVGAIAHYGTDAQKRTFLPLVTREGDKPAIAITEPDAGSAAADMTTAARRDGGSWVLNGVKHWITGAGVSRLYVVFCRFDGVAGAPGVGAIIVPSDAPGLTVKRRERAMGMRGIPEGEVVLADCRVPAENLLVGPGGFSRLMSAYNGQRLGASAVALGLAQGALEAAVAYAGERKQFGRAIGAFQGLRWMLADMAMEVESARQMIYRTAQNAGVGLPDQHAVAACKVAASEMAIRVTNQALQVFGAKGYSRDCPVERMVRDARMFTIAGGTVQMLRNLVANRLLGRTDRD